LYNYLDIAESTREEWFYDEEEQEEEHRKEEVTRHQGPSEFAARLSLVGTKARKSQKQNVNEWMDRVVGERPALSRVAVPLTELEKYALEGTTWSVLSSDTMSAQEAEAVISMHGGKIHNNTFTNPTHILTVSCPSPSSELKSTIVTESSLFSYIRSRVLEARLSGAPLNSLCGKSFSFAGVLPTLTRQEAESVVMRFGGNLLFNKEPSHGPDYLVRGVTGVSSATDCDDSEGGIETIIIDEDAFIRMVKQENRGETRRSGRIAAVERRKSIDIKKRRASENIASPKGPRGGSKRKRGISF
jgi:BRCT domain type II-containing protein